MPNLFICQFFQKKSSCFFIKLASFEKYTAEDQKNSSDNVMRYFRKADFFSSSQSANHAQLQLTEIIRNYRPILKKQSQNYVKVDFPGKPDKQRFLRF